MAQHIFATNDLPVFQGGMDRGIQRRLLLITFNRTIPECERIEHIGQRIADDEPDLLLDWAVDGASRLIKRRYFAEPASSRVALSEWLLEADAVLAWIKEATQKVEGRDVAKIRSAEAYNAFEKWALSQRYDANKLPKINTFVKRVTQSDAGIVSARDMHGRYLLGFSIKPTSNAGGDWGA